ncbi:MAG: ester cyclase [Candidatus Competibacter sp.]|nr:ester cyclase [Candidatus Competibacter sp.]
MADNSALEANKALVRRSFEAIWSQGNLAVADEILSSDYVGHIATLPEPVRGVEAFKQLVAMYHFSFPDTRFEIQDQIAEGHKVASRWIAHGTHRGEFMGIAPSGQAMSVTGMSFHRLDDGRIQESWDDWDALSILQGMTGDVFQSLSFHI